MQYLMLIYADQSQWPKLTKAEQEQGLAAYNAFRDALKSSGALIGANRLAPTKSARTVRVANGKRHVTDGPYVETKEQLGGYFLIEAESLDEALEWASRCPGASHGAIEVRPLWSAEA